MKAGRTRAQRRFILGGMLAATTALAVASVSWACTDPVGFTWYSDGTFQKSGVNGTIVTAYATGAKALASFNLVTGNNQGPPGHDGHACMFNNNTINPNLRKASASGFIANTSGAINTTPGTWQVCFREVLPLSGGTSTIPVYFTVL